MKVSLNLWVIVAGITLYFGLVLGVILFLRWRRKTRWPFKLEDKLLRGPGEALKQKIVELDERVSLEFFGGITGGFLVFAIVGESVAKFFSLSPLAATSLAIGGLAAVFGVSGWRIAQAWKERQNCFLGWFGERFVAEWLESSKVEGWRIFHDVPCANNGASFNIDHVAVGVNGVFVIETKTRRKGKARPGREDNKVIFDGLELDWPWGKDAFGLQQAEDNALWLADWIKSEVNELVQVTPLLALPAWWIDDSIAKRSLQKRLCRPVNPKWLPGILGRDQPVLTQKQGDLIATRLEVRCRDVTD